MLYVGRVCNQKGSDVLLEAVKTLHERRSDLQLVIAGPIGQFGMKAAPDRWVESVGGVYLGAVEESRLAAIYNLADVFVMPTRIAENLGMAAVEAQACGSPSSPAIARRLAGKLCQRIAAADFPSETRRNLPARSRD